MKGGQGFATDAARTRGAAAPLFRSRRNVLVPARRTSRARFYGAGRHDAPVFISRFPVHGEELWRNNGIFFLMTDGPSATAFDDAPEDILTGNAGADWFFANLDAGVKDKTTDLSADEFANDLDFIGP